VHKPADAIERKGSILGGEGSIFENLYKIGEDGEIVQGTAGQGGFGDTWLGDLLGFDGSFGVQGPGFTESFGGARRYQGVGTEETTDITTNSPGTNGGQSGNNQGDGDDGDDPIYGNLSGTTTAEKTAAVEEATAGVTPGPAASEGATTASTAGGGTTAGGADLDTAMGITGLKKGGLMAKGKKKK